MDIINSMGVEISLHKCINSNELYKSVEFASRLFVNGIELSPLPVGLILDPDRSSSLFRL